MAKYKLIANSVKISGIVYLKTDKTIFDTDGKHKAIKSEIEAVVKAGLLEEIVETKKSKKSKK